jgi:hypothetical protein
MILADRAVVTYDEVLQLGTWRPNSFQIEMFYDGTIRITWLMIDATAGIVGLSDGNGYPSLFFESDYSTYSECWIPECATNADCDDELVCNGREICVSGECIPGAPPICDDGVGCTVDSCSEDAGGCVAYPDDTLCEDGDECTTDLCDAVDGCINEPITGCCGNGICDGDETGCTCETDCGPPPDSESGRCDDGIDNDCDGLTDNEDDDCECSGLLRRCSVDADCCSDNCVGWGNMRRCLPDWNEECQLLLTVCEENADCCSNRCRPLGSRMRCLP